MRRWPELVRRHDIELLTVAPELGEVIACDRETLTSSATPEERTRFYPRARTRRVAHGLVDFVNEYVARLGVERRIVITRVDEAEATDAEWLAILLRRAHPDLAQGDHHEQHAANWRASWATPQHDTPSPGRGLRSPRTTSPTRTSTSTRRRDATSTATAPTTTRPWSPPTA